MAERERSHTRPLGGVFVAHSQVLTSADVQRALTRMAHEIVERNGGVEDVVLVGLQTGGVPLATRMAEILRQIEGTDTLDLGSLDVAFYRDDIGLRPVLPEAVTDVPVDLAGRVVVLVDDVLFTGRTIRAALNALNDFGRARAVQLAVMIDRGHRELPIRPDFVGKNLPDEARGDGRRRRGRRLDRHPGGPVTGPQHLLSVADLGADGIAEVLRVAEAFAEVERRSVPKVPTLRGKVVATLFFEESTRTRLSFETAAKRLSADVLSLAVATSSVKKGESLRDTVETVEAMGIDAVIIRHSSAGAPHQVARWVERAHVVNAGRRLARAPDPGPARLLHGAPGAGRAQGRRTRRARHRLLRGPARPHRRRRPPQPGGPLRGAGLHRARGARHPGRARAACCRPRSRAGRSRWRPTSTTRSPTPTSSRCSACRRSGGAGRSCPACASTRRAGASRPAGRRAWPRTPS